MKIIAGIDTRGKRFLVEMTEDEIAKVAKGTAYGSNFRIGDEFQVSGIFHRLDKLESNKKQLSDMAVNLRSMANLLESTEPVVRALVDEEPAEETTE